MFGDLYHNRVLELAADIPHTERLAAPHGAARRVSRVCGSAVDVEVRLGPDGRITAICVDPRACALGQAAASVLARAAHGKGLSEISAARDQLRDMLVNAAPPPEGDFWELRHLAPVHAYPPRHASTLLAFDAAVAAIEAGLAAAGASGEPL